MRIPRFYQTDNLHIDQDIELSADNFRHAIQVMRLKPNSPLILFDGEGGEYQATLTEVGRRSASARLITFDSVSRESSLTTKLVLALIKPDKMDFAIQKAVELGVNIIQPIITERSVIQLKASRLEKKMLHWQKVVISACEQSGRTVMPECLPPITLEDYLRQSTNALCIAMSPTATQRLSSLKLTEGQVDLIIGPEGGFTNMEENVLAVSNIDLILFGPRILRAETAVVAGLTALQISWGDC